MQSMQHSGVCILHPVLAVYWAKLIQSVSNNYEVARNAAPEELVSHSETSHPDFCEVIVKQTRGMTDEQVREWFKELDD